MPIILGIDPGLRDTGWGVISLGSSRKLQHVAHGTIQTSSNRPLEQRLWKISLALTQLIKEHSPVILAIETLFFQKNISSALPVAHARGVILCIAASYQLEVKSFTPNNIKQAVTGSGRATKESVEQMVKLLLKLNSIPSTNHAADALAAAIAAAYGAPVANNLT